MSTERQQAVVERLRGMILRKELEAGYHLQENQLSQLMSVSRTPIREALITLAHDGLVEYRRHRGYVVRHFSVTDVVNAYAVREVLEGMACRCVAELGLSADTRRQLEECLATGDKILSRGRLTSADREPWGVMNSQFHQAIVEGSRNDALAGALAKTMTIPMSSTRTVHWFDEDDQEGFFTLKFVHDQHHSIYQALAQGQGERAEKIMRVHIDLSAQRVQSESQAEAMPPTRARSAAE